MKMQWQWRVFVIYVLTNLFAKVTGHQSTESTIFIEQPESLDQCIIKAGSVVILQWKIQYEQCDLLGIYVNTLNHTLHPAYNESIIFLPIKENRDYNVTEDKDVCKSEMGKTEINVTLSIHLSEHVLKHVPYIVCTVSMLGDDGTLIDHRSEKVSFKVDNDTNCTVPDSTVTPTEIVMVATTNNTTNACYSMQYKTYQNSILFALLCLILQLMSDYYT